MIDRNHPRHKNAAMLQPALARTPKDQADLEKRRQREMQKSHGQNHKAKPQNKE